GARLATAGLASALQVWEVPSGELLSELRGHTEAVTCVAYSPDGRWLASGSDDHTVRLWDAATDDVAAGAPTRTPAKAPSLPPPPADRPCLPPPPAPPLPPPPPTAGRPRHRVWRRRGGGPPPPVLPSRGGPKRGKPGLCAAAGVSSWGENRMDNLSSSTPSPT